MSDHERIVARLRAVLSHRKWRQNKLAHELGIGETFISKILTGKYQLGKFAADRLETLLDQLETESASGRGIARLPAGKFVEMAPAPLPVAGRVDSVEGNVCRVRLDQPERPRITADSTRDAVVQRLVRDVAALQTAIDAIEERRQKAAETLRQEFGSANSGYEHVRLGSYCCHVVGKGPPKVYFETFAGARLSAERLVRLEKARVMIYRVADAVQPRRQR